ncbi:MAG: hypothetical protein ACRENP_00970 [Longimicrobiales bacterium]
MRSLVGALAALLLLGELLAAQTVPPPDSAGGWNSAAALQLMQRARVRREQPRGDTALRNYSAKASGHVYFYLDRQESEERTLVKVDQVALELYWAAPNLTKQRIVGLRDVNRLPNRQQYHLDHLTVVQNGFGDIIRLGDGDEVRDVPHPAASFSDSVYDFRALDVLTFTFPGQPAVRVQEMQVRPKRNDRSALIGSVFVDLASADIVRMTFTFTPASYVDRRLDYINISLDNGLWSGRYWLPNEQFVEIRRQIPELDFVAGAIIKGRMRVYDYQFNQTLPRELFFGPIVEARPRSEREKFAFEEELLAGLDREGLSSPPQVQALRAQAMELIRQKKLSGLPPLRLHVPNASSVLRFNRAEGLYLGGGASYVPAGSMRYEGTAGYAWAAGHATGSLMARYENESALRVSAHGFVNEVRDIGWRPGLPGALNTLSAAFAADDYLDPYYASGGRIEVARPVGSNGRLTVQAGIEHQRSARLGETSAVLGDASFRPVRPIERGVLTSVELGLSHPLLTRPRYELSAATTIESGLRDGAAYVRPRGSVELRHTSLSRSTAAALGLHGGLTSGRVPTQKLFLLGGRGTLPGYEYRNLTGDAFWLIEAEAAHDIAAPWLRLRAVAAYGGVQPAESLPPDWPPSRRTGYSIGLGIGLIYDIIRLDLVRGGTNSPRLIFSIKPDFWDMM